MSQRSVAVVGASANRAKYGNKAVRAYLADGWTVYPIVREGDQIEGIPAYRSLRDVPGKIDRVTFYVPPDVGLTLLEDVLAVAPDEFFLNPGSESPELVAKAKALGLAPIEACSILAIGQRPDDYAP